MIEAATENISERHTQYLLPGEPVQHFNRQVYRSDVLIKVRECLILYSEIRAGLAHIMDSPHGNA